MSDFFYIGDLRSCQFHDPPINKSMIRLTANRRVHIDSGDQGLSFGDLTILLASIVIEIIATFCENDPSLRNFHLFWRKFDPL